jgi:hypothetical protein
MEKVEVFLEKNPHFADVWLRGSDGRLVPAVRILLAMRSPVLKEILEGNMEEDRKVPLSYPSVALQGIVSYILTGKLIISDALDLMPSIDAANHFRLDSLANLAGTTLRDIQFDNYWRCFALVFSSGNLTVKEVKLIMLCTSKALSSALAKEIPNHWYELICQAPPEEDSSILDLLQAVQQSDVNGWITYDEKTFSGKRSRMLIPAFKGMLAYMASGGAERPAFLTSVSPTRMRGRTAAGYLLRSWHNTRGTRRPSTSSHAWSVVATSHRSCFPSMVSRGRKRKPPLGAWQPSFPLSGSGHIPKCVATSGPASPLLWCALPPCACAGPTTPP